VETPGSAQFDLEVDDGMDCTEVYSASITDPNTHCPAQIAETHGDIRVETPHGTLATRYQRIDDLAVVEGDIILGGIEAIEGIGGQSAGKSGASTLWPKAVVPYSIDGSLPNQARVTDAIKHWEANTALRFVKRTTESAYVAFVPGGGCSSYIGRIGGRQNINLASGCGTGAVIHEIGHAIGFWHEQERPDRDSVIRVNYANIQTGYADQFDIVKASSYVALSPYDLSSIMHYGPYAFSKNGAPTITLKDGSLFKSQRTGLSAYDKSGFAKLYASQIGTTTPPPAPPPPSGDKTAPTAQLESPAAGTSFRAYTVIQVVAKISDAVGVTSAELDWKSLSVKFPCPGSGGAWSCTRSGDTYRWNIRVGTGDRVFKVHARDAAGNDGYSAERKITFK
jgi:hypothetical protein